MDTTKTTINIYCLQDPTNGDVFYVGATSSKLKIRLSGHCTLLGYFVGNGFMKSKEDRIQKIMGMGLKPDIILLKTVSQESVDDEECFFYNLFTKLGFKLLQSDKQFQYSRSL